MKFFVELKAKIIKHTTPDRNGLLSPTGMFLYLGYGMGVFIVTLIVLTSLGIGV